MNASLLLVAAVLCAPSGAFASTALGGAPLLGLSNLDGLSPPAVGRIERFLRSVEGEPEEFLVSALNAYLKPRKGLGPEERRLFLRRDEAGRSRLTAAGRRALLDILLAEDAAGPGLSPSQKAAMRESVGAALHRVPHFDWERIDEARGYAIDSDRGTVRLLIAAPRRVKEDALGVAAPGFTALDAAPNDHRARLYQEAGLSCALLDGYGARLARAIDNLVVVDVPLAGAKELALKLWSAGIQSAPARFVRAAGAAASSAALETAARQPFALPSGYAEDPAGLGLAALRRAAMTGKGTLTGIVDTGIDESHADFRGRIEQYVDFTGSSRLDEAGHGTHGAGAAGGSGEASNGRFAGIAPETRFAVAKVFDRGGTASEDLILAAMKWLGRLAPDVLNLSFSAPGGSQDDPVSSLAEQLTAQRNVLVVAAAGNEGPQDGTVGVPASSPHVLAVTGADQYGEFPNFTSRGPVRQGPRLQNKPDVAAFGGAIAEPPAQTFWQDLLDIPQSALAAQPGKGCVFAPGVIAPKSGADRDMSCEVEGLPSYRYMSGTSMASFMVTGVSDAVIGYVKEHGAAPRPDETKALLMEATTRRGLAREAAGAGLISGPALVAAVTKRVALGLPIGNVALELSLRLVTSADEARLAAQDRYLQTSLGLFDKRAGRLLNTPAEVEAALDEVRVSTLLSRLSSPPQGS